MKNNFYANGNIVHVILTSKKYGNKETIIDKEDLSIIMEEDSWHAVCSWYDSEDNRATYYVVSGRTRLWMHRIILQTPLGKFTDHKNRDGLDNRKENLRIVTKRQNTHDRNDSILHTCVTRLKNNRYLTTIRLGLKTFVLPLLRTERQAGFCYDSICLARNEENIYAIQLTEREKYDLLYQLEYAIKRRGRNAVSNWIIRGLVILLKYDDFQEFTRYVLYAQSLITE